MTDATFQRLLQSVLFDNRYDRYVSNRRTGKLDTKKLRKISYSDKFFKKKEERKNKNYSIALLVDCSGSMRGEKAKMAFNAAYKLSKHLSSAKINHAIYAFHTPTVPIKAWGEKSGGKEVEHHLHDFLRNGDAGFAIPLDEPVGFEYDFWNPTALDYVGNTVQYVPKYKKLELPKDRRIVNVIGAGYNNDPYAIRYVAKELKKQAGTKVMIVLSDGQPAVSPSYLQTAEFPKERYVQGARELKKVVNDVINSGIELHSIGILDDSVNEYYPANRTCAVYDLGQLYDHIIKIVKLNMKRS